MCAGREPTIHNAFSGRQISSLNIITDPVAVVEKKNNILLGNSIFISINQNSTAVYLHSAGLTENCWKIYFNFADKSYSRLKRETAETLRQLETFILWNTIDSHPQGALNVTIYFSNSGQTLAFELRLLREYISRCRTSCKNEVLVAFVASCSSSTHCPIAHHRIFHLLVATC